MPTTVSNRDDRLADVIGGLTDALRAGRPADIDAAAAAHPDLATELRELWAVAQVAQLVATSPPARFPDISELTPRPTGELEAPALPRRFGDFDLLEELGRGGMGVVYKARQRSLNRVIALKMVREAHLATAADAARFRAEAEAAAKLTHPNIVTVYEVGTHDGQAYIGMEYVEGRTLARRVADDGPLPPQDAARLLASVARAVQDAHDHGILHRDLKPSNILIGNAECGMRNAESRTDPSSSFDSAFRIPHSAIPKISDFGLAKQADRTESLTRTGAVVGTPSYMSPEQATGRKDLTPAADVYSLGAVLYECLTGRPPFRASHPVDTLLMVLEQEPVRPRQLNPTVPRDLELVCLKCLQKPAELRYTSAAALAADLEAYLAGEPMSVESGSLGSLVARVLRETHHAAVLENWGLLWMWHSLMIFLLCLLTQVISWRGGGSHELFLGIWTTGLVTWGMIFWRLRRRGGPVLFVERQIAHVWAGSVAASIVLFVIEVVQKLPPLTLSPALAIIAGMVFVIKAGTLSGQFYITAGAYFLTAAAMAAMPQNQHILFGAMSAAAFFFPGLKYYRQRKRSLGLS